MFYNDFWEYSFISYFYGINPAQAENPIFYILMFQGPKRRPNDLIFYGARYLEIRRRTSQGSVKKEVRGRK